MKKTTNVLTLIFLLIFLLGVAILYLPVPKSFKNRLFYSTGLVPEEIFELSKKIDSISPAQLSQSRQDLLNQMDDFIKKAAIGNYFSARAYSLVKIRLDKALEEISKTEIPEGRIKLWYLYNMGVIVKSKDRTIAFDLPNSVVYSDINDFTKGLDVLIYTHLHADHFDPSTVKEAIKNGTTVIVPGDKVSLYENGNTKILTRDANGRDILDFLSNRYGLKSEKLIAARPMEEIVIKGISITGYPAIHMYNSDPQTSSGTDSQIANSPLDWFYVNLNGFTFLDTGDSTSLLSQQNFDGKVDMLITHIDDMRANDNLLRFVGEAGTILPLHVLELQHGRGILDYMMYKNVLDANSNGYWKGSTSTKFIPLIWGESIWVM